MHKPIYLFFLIFASTKSHSQTNRESVFFDSVTIIKTYTLSSDKGSILGNDEYFIFRNELYNNFVSADISCFSGPKFLDLYKVQQAVKNSIFYKGLMNRKEFTQSTLCNFLNFNKKVFPSDSLDENSICKSQNTVVKYKTVLIMFYTLTCNTEKEYIGNSVHYKNFEKLFFPFWHGKFLLPLLSK